MSDCLPSMTGRSSGHSSHLSAFKFVEMTGLSQRAFSSISVLSVEVDEHVGITSGPHHVSSEDVDLICVF